MEIVREMPSVGTTTDESADGDAQSQVTPSRFLKDLTIKCKEKPICNSSARTSQNAAVSGTVQAEKKRKYATNAAQKKLSTLNISRIGVKRGVKIARQAETRSTVGKKEPAPAKSSTTRRTKTLIPKSSKKQNSNRKKPDSEVLESLSQRLSPVSPPVSPGMDLTSTKSKERRCDDTLFERTVTPISTDAVESSIWDENVQNIVKSYDDSVKDNGRLTTILGFDVVDVRRQCNDDGRTALSAFVNCARKFQMSNAESCSVDTGMKEDRRAMAAAKNRNRQLNTGYYV
ncbi:hypothetical protein OESDEN_24279 [Oesophagostomum dentatum]|uniref:Uncharacterized protein n=1 Tax=Oesophagostomum dentatum TaxID=61180 RepID=A0A0B1RSQ2_OESDE|nr:hypothetical protein OESDEN_24279 [Oesophagostomum dentatum]